MTGFKLRVVRLAPIHGVAEDNKYGIQISEFGLVWCTLVRYESLDDALTAVKELVKNIETNQLVKQETVIWTYPKKQDMTVK